MNINEIKEAKIKLENDIEVLLNDFDKVNGTIVSGIEHNYIQPLAFGGAKLNQVFHSIQVKIEI